MPYVARDDQGHIIDVQERETEAAYEQVALHMHRCGLGKTP